MNQRIAALRELIIEKRHRDCRRSLEELGIDRLSETFAEQGLSPIERVTACLEILFEKETPVILPGERIVFTRTVAQVPELFTEQEWAEIRGKYYLHERGYVCNISPDYETTIRKGLAARKQEVIDKLNSKGNDAEAVEFLQSVRRSIEAIQNLIEKYALEQGDNETAAVLRHIKTDGAKTLREALQLLRILHYSLWASGNYHNTLGRFDQYIYPYYQGDIQSGRLTREEAFDLVEEFFLVCNKDSDLYPGMQQGDNGQSLVLGGRSASGEYLFNDLSKDCLRASYELNLIDPKINIRVDKDTPLEIYEMGSELTKIGQGFPQYCNDDVVIPGLIRKGYSEEDARNYVVAACWEFIIPKVAMDIPNIDGLSLIACVQNSVAKLQDCPDFQTFMQAVSAEIKSRFEAICAKHKNLWMIPAPVMSLLMDGTIARGRD
ncbi:MAG: pyruvate formate lyase family protein, partial [Dysgonamonadaceae bacterium]|nr:pyruvate formate lyase family protein [Dysgonamonadaceae bacterium]